MSRYARVDSGTDDRGNRWEVGVRGPALVVTVAPTVIALYLEGAERAKFGEAVTRAVAGEAPSE